MYAELPFDQQLLLRPTDELPPVGQKLQRGEALSEAEQAEWAAYVAQQAAQ